MPVGQCGQWVVRRNWSPRSGEPEGGWTRAESRKASRLRHPLAGHREVARVWAAAGASARASHGALPGCPLALGWTQGQDGCGADRPVRETVEASVKGAAETWKGGGAFQRNGRQTPLLGTVQ